MMLLKCHWMFAITMNVEFICEVMNVVGTHITLIPATITYFSLL